MFNLLGNIVSGTAKTLAVLTASVIGVGCIAMMTKPSDEYLRYFDKSK